MQSCIDTLNIIGERDLQRNCATAHGQNDSSNEPSLGKGIGEGCEIQKR